jgi:LuxR family transcriptional regulator, maltose regulon positive regulatory protein
MVGAQKAAHALPEPLTEREQVVLRFLSTTMSTAEIADELFLSVNTIKTHLGSIYRKLAAGKRRDAVVRARELELL